MNLASSTCSAGRRERASTHKTAGARFDRDQLIHACNVVIQATAMQAATTVRVVGVRQVSRWFVVHCAATCTHRARWSEDRSCRGKGRMRITTIVGTPLS